MSFSVFQIYTDTYALFLNKKTPHHFPEIEEEDFHIKTRTWPLCWIFNIEEKQHPSSIITKAIISIFVNLISFVHHKECRISVENFQLISKEQLW